jgi:hypothetical protein
MKLGYGILFCIALNAVNANIIEAPNPKGNVIVREKDGEQSLFFDNKPLKLVNRFINVNRMLPTPKGAIDVYLIESNAGGSGTLPSYNFLFITEEEPNTPQLSKDFGDGQITSINNNGNSITIKFNKSLTVIYKDGVISEK